MSKAPFALLLLAGAALGEERFGSRGTVAPAGAVGLIYIASGGPNEVFAFVDPGAMVFVADGLAVGGFLHFSASSSGPSFGYGAAPAIGANLWLAERLSLYPQALLRMSWQRFGSGGS